jgi:hypothetical protein
MKTPASANETITDQFLIKKWRLFFNLEKKAVRRTPKSGPGVKLGLWWSGAGLEPKLNHTK